MVGERREQTIAELVSLLRELRDPAAGEPIVQDARRGADLYHGDYANYVPDVVLHLRDHLYSASQKAFAPKLVGLGVDTGTHQPEGIFGALGHAQAVRSGHEVVGLASVARFLLEVVGIPSDPACLCGRASS